MKYKKVLISGIFLTELFTEGNVINTECLSGLPKGTKFCYSIPDNNWGIWIVIQHESFPILEDGNEIPDFEKPILKKL